MDGKFSLGAILSVTTRVMCINGIDGIYEILNYMTADDLYTHSLPRAADECTPYLYEQLPFLREISKTDVLPDAGIPKAERPANCFAKVAALADKYGEWHTVRPIHMEDHEHLTPEEDLRRLGFKGEIIRFDIDDEPSPYGNIS